MHGPDTVIRAIELQMNGPKGLIGPTPNGGDAAGINDVLLQRGSAPRPDMRRYRGHLQYLL